MTATPQRHVIPSDHHQRNRLFESK